MEWGGGAGGVGGGFGNGGAWPTAAEVEERIKDDGDFDSLRVQIIRKVKQNEELRNTIISEVKQSIVLNEEGSEKYKLRELSDAVYQEIGSRIMGQISDDVWKVIKSSEADIRATVESVFNRIVNPEEEKAVHGSPAKKIRINGKDDHVSPLKPTTSETNDMEENEPDEPPGFASSDHQHSNGTVEHQLLPNAKQSPSAAKEHDPVDAAPPGFGNSGDVDAADEDPDVPPGFG